MNVSIQVLCFNYIVVVSKIIVSNEELNFLDTIVFKGVILDAKLQRVHK